MMVIPRAAGNSLVVIPDVFQLGPMTVRCCTLCSRGETRHVDCLCRSEERLGCEVICNLEVAAA